MDSIQDAAEESNTRIRNLIEATRDAVGQGSDRVDDDWYRQVMSDMAEVLFYLGAIVDDLSYPVYPGKYAPILDAMKNKISDGPMDRGSIRMIAESMHVPAAEADSVVEMLKNGQDIVCRDGKIAIISEDDSGNEYRDCRGRYDDARVKELVLELADGFEVGIESILCYNPFRDKVEVRVSVDATTKLCDVIQFKRRLEDELGTWVTVYADDGDERLDLPY